MKPKSRLLWATGLLALCLSLFFYACTKDSSSGSNNTIPPGSQRLSVYITDGPLDFQKVLIDIQGIAVKVDTCHRNHDDDHDQPGCDDDHDMHHGNCEIWDTLNIHPGVYDLLTLSNGLDTLLGSSFLINGKIERIKLTLGNNNSVEVDSIVYPLHLLNNQNYVYVNISRDHLDSLSSNNFQLFLDFDLDHSIKYFNEQDWLKPVLKPFGLHNTGEIEGTITPQHASGFIRASNATDNSYALPGRNGRFEIRGLSAGNYSVFIAGINGYQDTTLTNISVTARHETILGSVQLHQ